MPLQQSDDPSDGPCIERGRHAYLAYSGAALPTMLLRPAKLLGALSHRHAMISTLRSQHATEPLLHSALIRGDVMPVRQADRRATSATGWDVRAEGD